MKLAFNKLVLAPRYESFYDVAIAMNASEAIGLNRLDVVLDEENRIEEYDDFTNNQTQSTFFVVSDDVIIISPREYAIEGDSDFSLIASSPDVFGTNSKNYLIEIDTTFLFNSPINYRITYQD